MRRPHTALRIVLLVALLGAAGCGAEAQIGEARAFVEAPGLVLRCSSCDNALVVLVRTDDRYVLGMSGLAWLELRG